jgi:hypothetical protein
MEYTMFFLSVEYFWQTLEKSFYTKSLEKGKLCPPPPGLGVKSGRNIHEIRGV